jgi:acetyl esterase
MTIDAGARAYVERVNAGLPIWEVSLEEARRAVDGETLEIFGPVDEVAPLEDRLVEGVRVRIYRPAARGPLPALVYFHGGGWVVGSIESHDPVCRAIASRAPGVVVSVDYRLASEHCFPAGLEDAWTVTEWAATHLDELGADRVAVGGDSSGGNLAAVVALRARDRGVPLALQLLIYPVIDCDLDSPGYMSHGVGLNLTRAKMEWYWGKYMNGADPAQPEASPLRAADVVGVAPVLIVTAGYDPLCHEAEAYARRLEGAGVPVELAQYQSQIHGFVRLAAVTRDARRALEEVAQRLSVS